MKKTVYPKTKRIGNLNIKITEKLDGSNLGIFKLNGELIIAQRNYIFKLSELTKENSYKGLMGWLEKYAECLDLHEGSGVFGEWIAMGKIGYGDTLDKKFYIFAKANIDGDCEVSKINYKRDSFIYPFESQKIPDCMGVVPLVKEVQSVSIDMLNDLYEKYLEKCGRQCEGFIVNQSGNITKYVRHKNGILTKHKP